jgi:hypothetical protein
MGEGGGTCVSGNAGGGSRCAVPGEWLERAAGASGVELLPPAPAAGSGDLNLIPALPPASDVGCGDLELIPAHFPALPPASAVGHGDLELIPAHFPTLPSASAVGCSDLELVPTHVPPASSLGNGLGSASCSLPMTEAEAQASDKFRCKVDVGSSVLVD